MYSCGNLTRKGSLVEMYMNNETDNTWNRSHLGFILGYEQGDLRSQDELVSGFQAMIDDGTVWKLQGSYGRTAQRLIEMGLCHA